MADLNPSARQVLLDLADRCEREEPSMELDGAIGYAVDATPKAKRVYKRGHYIGNKPVLLRIEAVWLPYTSSLDAAVTLEPADAQEVVVRKYPNGRMYVRITTAAGKVAYCEGLDRPIGEPMARLAASLRSRAEAL